MIVCLCLHKVTSCVAVRMQEFEKMAKHIPHKADVNHNPSGMTMLMGCMGIPKIFVLALDILEALAREGAVTEEKDTTSAIRRRVVCLTLPRR